MVNESILTSIKKLQGGIQESYKNFDEELIMHINTVFSILTQLGIGPKNGFHIESEDETWADFLGESNLGKLEMVKSYMGMKVGLMFDQTKTGAVIEELNKRTSELEWRLNVAVDPGDEDD